jgi:gas vesicle protein GvpL/GvpF
VDRVTKRGTYVFCVVAARAPRLAGVPAGLSGMGRPRALEIHRGLHAIVADAPLARYGEPAINSRLSDLDWVSHAAVAHEAVVEHFVGETAVLPMKLFTIFSNDERAVEHIRGDRSRFDAIVKRVAHQHEWGVRVLLDRIKASAHGRRPAAPRRKGGGLGYLLEKKARRDAAVELSSRAQKTVAALYDQLERKSRLARRRIAAELPAQGSLLLDAAFLVPRSRTASFRALAARRARELAPKGYLVTLTGPWPPYTFVQD